MPVLIITERNDIHGHALIWALNSLGIRCDRWSLTDFPERQPTSVRLSNASSAPCFKVPGLLASEAYISVWLRRVISPRAVSERLDRADVKMALMEAQRFSDGLRSTFAPGATWINPRKTRAFANSKPYQLQTAKEVGFTIPETLLSNDLDEIRLFYKEHKGNVVYKPFAPAFWENRSEGSLTGLFTSELTDAILQEDAASFTSCPGIYQQYISKKSELRVTFFGGTYQAARIHSQQIASGSVDYRSDMKGESQMESAVLDSSLLEKCKAFSTRLGLLHGSFDLIETPDGQIIFLEINEMGQFLWLEERVPQMPMLAMFAAFSLEPSPDFAFNRDRWPSLSFHDFLRAKDYTVFRQDLAEYASSSEKAKAFYYPE